ncbi:MAG: Rieske 2Fe-2S domain-containing protein [Acidimicrobiia bacterium]|nr:Rieske 2Fe-2S domain-containing protein [Acidimicrobiia bacterium]MDH4307179.1 Rieske 2Fe-2S domain-containing protein [Acidimicrobiia bacterium]MDH5292935.1 Rieske 2Fe-2S domain-containing protein [Acidimicrobiia bacterium]
MVTEKEAKLRIQPQDIADKAKNLGRPDWTKWPVYDSAAAGLRDYWYPVLWSNQLRNKKPLAIRLCGEDIMLMRDRGTVYALHDRCPHRGVPLSLGIQEFEGTITCPYHAWTFDLADGDLVAVITDGPDSPICGKAAVKSYPVTEMLGLIWVYVGDSDPPPPESALPEELRESVAFVMGGRVADREGNWRLAAENGFDEGHAKYLHRTSTWRTFKAMPTWNITKIVPDGRWIYRVQQEVHWSANFPGLGEWSNIKWWKIRPKNYSDDAPQLGNTGGAKKADEHIVRQKFPGFASITVPGVLRIAYPKFIHYEFYVPKDENWHRYVGIMVRFVTGWRSWLFRFKYWAVIRPHFHGNFSNLDAWMVEATDAPPERLYRPDSSLLAWRRLVERTKEGQDLEEAVRDASDDVTGVGDE